MRRLFAAILVSCAPFASANDDAPKKSVDWGGSIDLVAGGEAGNNENYNVGVNAQIDFTGEKWSATLLDLEISDTVIRRDDGENEKTRDHSIYADGNVQRAFGSGKYGASVTWEWKDSIDEDDSLNRYWNVGLGFNAKLYKGTKAELRLISAGVTYEEEYPRGKPSFGDVWGSLIHSFKWAFSRTASFDWESTIKFNPSDKASQERRVKSKQELTLQAGVTKHISIPIRATWLWDSAPVSVVDENVDGYDLSISMGLRASW